MRRAKQASIVKLEVGCFKEKSLFSVAIQVSATMWEVDVLCRVFGNA